MTATTAAGPRIASLDVVRGVAVMGILAMNIVGFAMPFQAYMNPLAFSDASTADMVSWAFSFIFIDGKMRGLFSFLFGASMLLVIQRAEESGQSPASVHYRRMAWLLVFGLIHFYFIWFGDILSAYALTGMVAFLFRGLSVRALIRWAIFLLVLQFLLFASFAGGAAFLAASAAQPGADPAMVAEWKELKSFLGPLTGQPLAEKLALFQGPWVDRASDQLDDWSEPFTNSLTFGAETLAYFLLGMAAFKSGFLTGEWSLGRYRRWAVIGVGLTVPAYALLAWIQYRDSFSVPVQIGLSMAATTPLRAAMIVAYAAIIILLARRGGAFVDRVAATGRAAFTNYLGTSILMTILFHGHGLGLYGSLSRAELWIPVIGTCALMLLWSKPWLDRYRYGPLEWLWRSLARARLEPMRRSRVPVDESAAR